MTDFTPRNLAKDAVTSAIAMKLSQLTKDAIADYTRFDKDTIAVKIGSGIVGGIVANKLKPATDKMVDKTADFIATKRADRKAKKTAKKTKD